MFKLFTSLSGAVLVISLFLSVPCYADETGKNIFFDHCELVETDEHDGTTTYTEYCKLEKDTDRAKTNSYSCDGDTCRFQLASDYPGSPVQYVYAYNNMPYSLCSKAFCEVKTQTINGAITRHAECNCPIYPQDNTPVSAGDQAPIVSLGTQARNDSLPEYDVDGNMITVTSTFSLANISDQIDVIKSM